MDDDIIFKIKNGGVGVLPTDTIFGLVGDALNREVCEKIAKLKNRDTQHKFVVLACSWHQLDRLGVRLSSEQRSQLNRLWPGPVTVVLDAPGAPPHLTSSDDGTIAIRWPNKNDLSQLINKTGPIIATSVNISGEAFINSLKGIKDQFPELDFYEQDEVTNRPSEVVRIFKDGSTKQLR